MDTLLALCALVPIPDVEDDVLLDMLANANLHVPKLSPAQIEAQAKSRNPRPGEGRFLVSA